MKKVILASQSYIRKRAMDLLGIPYEVHPSYIDEKAIRDPDPFKMALMLSEAKARAVGKQHKGIIIASDAFMVFKNQIVEKPESLEEAYNMLKGFSGSNYTFVTSLSVLDTATDRILSAVESCHIHFRTLHDAEIHRYIQAYPVLKLAGAHETDAVSLFSTHVQGNCNLFTAMPMNRLYEFLSEFLVLTHSI